MPLSQSLLAKACEAQKVCCIATAGFKAAAAGRTPGPTNIAGSQMESALAFRVLSQQPMPAGED